ncbi:hypothetical protein [Plantactinospora sp. GCM10030261]|uniref:hypothetical protein n=1 Tax=Plantactinospora sp. GCM10030261 TaxID=3273420 RepID=UPI0036124473
MTADQMPPEVISACGRQRGLVTAAQLDRLGVDRAQRTDLSRRGLLTRLDWDVFEILGSPTPPRFAYPYAAWLALRPASFTWERPGAAGTTTADAVLSHEGAASVLGLGAPSLSRFTFTAPTPLAAPRATRVLLAPLRPDEVSTHNGLPVTTAHRTVVDLVRSHADHLELRGIITDAVRLDLVDLAALHRDLSPLADEHRFPAEGPEFAGWFLPDLDDAALSPRNAHALAALLRPATPTDPPTFPEAVPGARPGSEAAVRPDGGVDVTGPGRHFGSEI